MRNPSTYCKYDIPRRLARNLHFCRRAVGNTLPWHKWVIRAMWRIHGDKKTAAVLHLPFKRTYDTDLYQAGPITLTGEQVREWGDV